MQTAYGFDFRGSFSSWILQNINQTSKNHQVTWNASKTDRLKSKADVIWQPARGKKRKREGSSILVVSPLHLTLDLSTSEGSNVSLLMGLKLSEKRWLYARCRKWTEFSRKSWKRADHIYIYWPQSVNLNCMSRSPLRLWSVLSHAYSKISVTKCCHPGMTLKDLWNFKSLLRSKTHPRI